MLTTDYQGLHISYPDQLEFESVSEEIFKQHNYYVDLDTTTPYIIDAGANIGLSLLYLHKQYPRGTFVCIEPSPQNLQYLRKNIEENGLENATVIEKALVGKDGKASVILYTHPRWGVFSSLKAKGWSQDQEMIPIEVPSIKLSELLTKPVDLLKMDIEGAEDDVLHECKDGLRFVSHFILEYHETHKGQMEKTKEMLSHIFEEVTVTKDDRKEKNREHQLYLIEASN